MKQLTRPTSIATLLIHEDGTVSPLISHMQGVDWELSPHPNRESARDYVHKVWGSDVRWIALRDWGIALGSAS